MVVVVRPEDVDAFVAERNIDAVVSDGENESCTGMVKPSLIWNVVSLEAKRCVWL